MCPLGLIGLFGYFHNQCLNNCTCIPTFIFENFASYTVLSWKLSSISTFKILFHCPLISIVAVNKPAVNLFVALLKVIFLSLACYQCIYLLERVSQWVQSLSGVWLWDPMDWKQPGFPVHYQLPELAQTHVHWVGDAIQPSHPLLSPSPPAFNLSQHLSFFQWVSSSHQVAKVLKFQLQRQSFQWIFMTDFL